MNRVFRVETIVVVLVLALSLALRLTGLNVFIVSDELRWTCRSVGFRAALLSGNWAGTFRIGHPGVVTTWLGTLFIPTEDAQAQETCRETQDASRFHLASGTPEEQAQHLAELGLLLFKGRVGVALFTWLFTVAIYLLARLLWGPRIAALGLALVALDPFLLAHSRFLHIDAVLTGVMTLSVLSLLASVRQPKASALRWGLLAISGATAGLAMLQKSPALFLAPFAASLLATDVLRQGANRETLLRAARDLCIWGLLAGLVYVAMWPAMWTDPTGTIERVLDKAVGYAEEGHEGGNYFLGRPVHDPGWGFYPVAAAFRLSPLTVVGLIAALYRLVRGNADSERRFDKAVLLAYSVLFGVFMSLGAKKFDRYLLPVFPALDLVAAGGLFAVIKAAQARVSRLVAWLPAYAITLIVCAVLVLPHYPYYLTYYDPLLGGIRQAQNVLLVGWGEGDDRAAAYLNAKPDARQTQATVLGISTFAPLFKGRTLGMARHLAWQSDYVVFYISHVQRLRRMNLLEEYVLDPAAQPEHTVTLHSVEYVWIYPNTHYVEPSAYVEERSRPDREILLVNGESVFAKHYAGALQVRKFYNNWSPWEIAGLLNDLPLDCHQVWYARYPDSDSNAALDLLRSRGLLVEEQTFPLMEIVRYRLVEPELQEQLNLRFGDLRLRGIGLTDPPPTWGQDGGVILEWEALQPLEEDYSAFLHLYDAHDQRIAQGDTLIADEMLRPTSRWEVGSPSSILYHLPIPPGTPPGRHELEVGVYLYETGKRLPLLGPDGENLGTATRLEVEVGVPQQMPTLSDLTIPHPSQRDLTPQLRLLGYEGGEELLLAGQTIPVHLFWQATGEMDQAYRLQLAMRGADGAVHGQGAFDLVTTDYPTTRWQPGELLHEWYRLPTGEETPTGEAALELNLLDEGGQPVLAQPVEVTRVWVQSTRPSFVVPPDIGKRYEVNLGDQVTLLGYDPDSGPVRPGETFYATLYWQAQQRMETSYKVFVHLYDGQGGILAQQDRIPGLGARPTTMWEIGEVVADRFGVPVGPDAPAGVYPLAVGLYDEATGERLAAFGPHGERLDQDRISLGQVEVGP